MGLTTLMLDRIRMRIYHHVPFYYRQYFTTMEGLERLWSFYTAPEAQKGLVEKVCERNSQVAIEIKGDYSWGVTEKMDRAERIKE